ncbi:hypothetical protein TH53_00470 [Pedobacter lusitanus]|uniref:Tail specific protease domain-containing protein n=1 Tax=Pedobacter lusitanus TaxID=1503925 RepID=A0A0D0G2J0_9SPHI|nr:hypothetical protein TH53_00470 [Pedobacter lusitanus]
MGIILIISTFSCRKEVPQINQPERYTQTNFADIFQSYWTGMNNSYIFWDIDHTNWDDVYKKYKPIFAKLNANDSTDIRKAYTYFKEMTSNLVDSHYTLKFNNDYLQDSAWIQPARSRHEKQPGYHGGFGKNFFKYTLMKKYLDTGAMFGDVTTYDRNYVYAVAGKIKANNILYLHFNTFYLKEVYGYTGNFSLAIRRTLQYYLDQVRNPAGLRGIIIDVRSNGGGQLADLDFLIGPLTDKSYVIGATRGKSGTGRLDYGPWIDAKVNATGANAFTAPVIILADVNSISMSEMTTMAIKALPSGNGKFVGEQTWGGTGPLSRNEFFNSGQFSTGFFRSVYTSSLMMRDKDGKIYENIGLSPDIEVKYDAAAIALGNDPQLERAINLIP